MDLSKLFAPTAEPSTASEYSAFCGDLQNIAPHLHELLTRQVYEGKKRETATIVIYADQGEFKACLSDRENARSVHVTLSHVLSVFEDLENVLQGDKIAWRKRQEFKWNGKTTRP